MYYAAVAIAFAHYSLILFSLSISARIRFASSMLISQTSIIFWCLSMADTSTPSKIILLFFLIKFNNTFNILYFNTTISLTIATVILFITLCQNKIHRIYNLYSYTTKERCQAIIFSLTPFLYYQYIL